MNAPLFFALNIPQEENTMIRDLIYECNRLHVELDAIANTLDIIYLPPLAFETSLARLIQATLDGPDNLVDLALTDGELHATFGPKRASKVQLVTVVASLKGA
jgi:hypothetical protein